MKTWIYFDCIESKPKTSVWAVRTKSDNTIIAKIKWFPSWRTYAFFPEEATIYELDCLGVISRFIENLMDKRKIRKTK